MPTFELLPRFASDLGRLTPADRSRFDDAVALLVADLRTGVHALRPSLRVKRVRASAGVWEMTWANNGRATFAYGEEVIAGAPHVIWRRIGTHAILAAP
ncbi:hypothetical protein ACN20G_37160 (plasmid) [Streptomyces sp. BI20]|uniref:hypothetical protein n=1 Tax=Streptomyces sp. BI20 TaxID=3403460 RepID=UPI003C73E2DA